MNEVERRREEEKRIADAIKREEKRTDDAIKREEKRTDDAIKRREERINNKRNWEEFRKLIDSLNQGKGKKNK